MAKTARNEGCEVRSGLNSVTGDYKGDILVYVGGLSSDLYIMYGGGRRAETTMNTDRKGFSAA